MQKEVKMQYTTDLEQEAIDEVKAQLEEAGFAIIGEFTIEDPGRACRNAYGKTMDEDDFDAIDPDSDEAWFDDHDYVIRATVSKDCTEEEFKEALDKTGGWLAEED